MKPLIGVQADDGIALATEEQALRSLYREEIAMINYDGPSLTEVWTAAQPSGRVA